MPGNGPGIRGVRRIRLIRVNMIVWVIMLIIITKATRVACIHGFIVELWSSKRSDV